MIELEQNKKTLLWQRYSSMSLPFCFVQVHKCNKHFVKKIMPENRDLNSKQKNHESHFFQNRAARVQPL